MNFVWLGSVFAAFLVVALILAWYPLRHQSKWLKASLPPLFLILSLSAYMKWGGWCEWSEHQALQKRKEEVKALLHTASGKSDLINKLKVQLKSNPSSARGWFLLGRLYVSDNDWQQASTAFEKAYQLNPEDEGIIVNYAQSKWQLNQGQFDGAIRALFSQVLQQNPNQLDALTMLAMDAFMSHDYQIAINYWRRLLKLVPSESEDAAAIRKAIVQAQEKLRFKQEGEHNG